MGGQLTSIMAQKIEKGISILANGGIIAYPTDTVYGLGACYDNVQAIKRIYEAKNRPVNMPLPLLLAEVSWIERVTFSIPEVACQLIDSFLPGALTLVMKKSDNIPDIVSGGKETVAVRIPDHFITIALINGVGRPLIGTSANLNGHSSALSAEEVYNQLGEKIDYILDGGVCPGGKESSIVDVTGKIPKLLREGAITKKDIEKVCQLILPGEEN